MATVTAPAHQKGDFFVDYEEKVFEDVKAEPGEKALVTFHTVAFEGSIGLVNILQALRLRGKATRRQSCCMDPASPSASNAASPRSATKPSRARRTSTTNSSASWMRAARSMPAASPCRRYTVTANRR